MEDVRLIAKGTITDLSKGFSLGGAFLCVCPQQGKHDVERHPA